MSKLREQVIAFHRAYGQPVKDSPEVPEPSRVRLRLRLITEEYFELLDSVGLKLPGIKGVIDECVGRCVPIVDLPEFADALADIDYLVEGARAEFGVDGGPVADEVHRSNMSKLGPDGRPMVRDDGKVVKGPSYSPPDLARVLREQGWVGQ